MTANRFVIRPPFGWMGTLQQRLERRMVAPICGTAGGLPRAGGWKIARLRKIPLHQKAPHAMKSLMIKSMNNGNWWWAR
jgi:hypothetical protein